MTRLAKRDWPAESKTHAKRRLVRSGGSTACATTNLAFAVFIADKILELASEFVGGRVAVSAYTPSGHEADGFGAFVVQLHKDRLRRSISVMFPTGRPDPAYRQALEIEAGSVEHSCVAWDGIRAACWDEAWLVVCEIGSVMDAKQLILEYGGYER